MLGIIGFGEAGRSFASAGNWSRHACAFDIKTTDLNWREAKIAEYREIGIAWTETLEETVRGAGTILSLVTADQALRVATATSKIMEPGALYLDMNSVAPQTKLKAARLIEAAGGRYVDVAVMAPVEPARMAVSLLLSGAAAADATISLAALGFSGVRSVGDRIGQASSIKMIRSVMVKGLEALTAECLLAAQAAGVQEEVMRSLDSGDGRSGWAERANYNLDRMMVHGLRRAAEMEEVIKTLEGIGTDSAMTRGTAEYQRLIGAFEIDRPERELTAKIAQILKKKANAA